MMKTVLIRSIAALTTAITADVADGTFNLDAMLGVNLQASFVYGADGTTCAAWVQTSLDGGASWIDVANFAFTTATAVKVMCLTRVVQATPVTPGDAALASNTTVNGILGAIWRVKVTSTGTYAGVTSLKVWATPA